MKDNAENELVELLLTKAGAILEDASAVALLQRGQSLPQRLECLSKVLERLTALITAAATLVDHEGEAT